MANMLDPIDRRLFGEWQRGFPLVPRPFAEIGAALDVPEQEIMTRLTRASASGTVSRVGATLRPNTVGASTLAAVAATDLRVDEIAGQICAEPGINHSYLRENDWNIWFVATGPDRASVDATLARIRTATGLPVLDLPLIRPYNLDLGFALEGPVGTHDATGSADPTAIRDGDREILQALTQGMPIVARPFLALGNDLSRPENDLIGRIQVLCRAGVISRLGIILRHRALGWRSNAMVVWNLPREQVDQAGISLGSQPGVTLCYQRRPDPEHWPYNLFCMIHARSRDQALTTLTAAAAKSGLAGIPHRVLFSVRCFKQTGAMVLSPRETTA